jgi:hypothetical protein
MFYGKNASDSGTRQIPLVTLGKATPIEMILSVSCAAVADVFTSKHRQCTQAFHEE